MINKPKRLQLNRIKRGGGWSVITGWGRATFSRRGKRLWQILNHKSACLSCAWGTGGQNGGFRDELGEPLQRCIKSVEAIRSELQSAVPQSIFDRSNLSELQQLDSSSCDQLGRLDQPLIKTIGRDFYAPISWDQVYQILSNAFKTSDPERLASYSSGRSSNEAAYLLQLLMRARGSNNLADCSDLCHAPSSVGLTRVFGSGTSNVSLESLRQADAVVLVGSNAPANHPRLMNELIRLRDRGGLVVVINPVMEGGLLKFGSPAFPIRSLLFSSEIASVFLQPIPGSDTAVFLGFQKAWMESGAIATDFIQSYSDGWEKLQEQLVSTSWHDITQCCGLSKQELQYTAARLAQCRAVVFAWAMGITHHSNGSTNVQAIANSAVVSGNVGRPGTGTMPIRGHSNVQGFGSMGVSVRLREPMRHALESLLDCPLSRTPGYHARDLIEAADRGEVDALICLGGNLFGANPDSTEARRALSKIDTIAYLATKPNQGHFHGLAARQTLLLPVLNRFETPHRTTVESGNNWVRLNEPGSTHLKRGNLVSEVEFLSEMAHRIFGDKPINWKQLQDPLYVRKLIAKTVPGYEQMSDIDSTNQEFEVRGRVFSEPRFSTPNGRAQITPTPLPKLILPGPDHFGGLGAGERGFVLNLITARSHGQHNTVVYKQADWYRGMLHRQTILINPADLRKHGIAAHERVTVQGEAGSLQQIELIPGSIRQGCGLMFFPEANILMRGVTDKTCGTPAFKRVPILIRAKN